MVVEIASNSFKTFIELLVTNARFNKFSQKSIQNICVCLSECHLKFYFWNYNFFFIS